MAWTVFDEGDQVEIALDPRGFLRGQLFQQRADAAHHINVLLLVAATDVVRLAGRTLGHDGQ
ncbi:hypothetical protein D3C73_1672510 [compost metagenome]